jgi:hypothetical protein
MNNDNQNYRALWFIIVFLLAMAVFSNLSFSILLFLLGAAAFWMVRNADMGSFRNNFDLFNNGSLFNTRQQADYYADEDDAFYEDDEPSFNNVQREPVYRHALTAVENAGHDPDTVQVLAVDLGVMAYRQSEQPVVYRTWTVPDDVDALQPFVTLRLPTTANGRVRFEMLDSSGKTTFLHENDYQLEKGRNFISPPARLPMRETLNHDGQWQLRISADDVLLAVHRFEFAEPTTATIRRHIGEDGEISTDSRLLMDETPMPKMSLDDLLSYQDEEEKSRRK